MSAPLLVELRTEELPPKALAALGTAFARELRFTQGDAVFPVIVRRAKGSWRLGIGDATNIGQAERTADGRLAVVLDGIRQPVSVTRLGDSVVVRCDGETRRLGLPDPIASIGPALVMPATLSSTTTQAAGSAFICAAANRNRSGAGLPRATWVALNRCGPNRAARPVSSRRWTTLRASRATRAFSTATAKRCG